MKTVTIDVFSYDELSDNAKARARDWYREASRDDNFAADNVVEYFALTVAPRFGWTVETRKGSGFQVYWDLYRQGSGACFEGHFDADKVDPAKVCAECPTDAELHALCDRMAAAVAGDSGAVDAETRGTGKVRHSGRYYHSGCMDFDFDAFPGADDAVTVSRALADWLHGRIEDAVEWEGEDDTVAENIRANGYAFTADGERETRGD